MCVQISINLIDLGSTGSSHEPVSNWIQRKSIERSKSMFDPLKDLFVWLSALAPYIQRKARKSATIES